MADSSPFGPSLHLALLSAAAGAALGAALVYHLLPTRSSNDNRTTSGDTASTPAATAGHAGIADGVLGAIGNTPLIRLRSLSAATGCDILGKGEFLNPGGSVKDRVALQIIREALDSGRLRPGGLVTEGTVGSTGVSLSVVCAALGLRCHVCLPDDAALEKARLLEAHGATIERLRPVSIAHPMHFVNVARRRAAESDNGIFADQFENLANFRAHIATADEILAQTSGRLDAFIAGAGTGGTLAGVSRHLKSRNPAVQCWLADPPGSSLYNRVTRGAAYTREEAEGRRLRNPFDTITEGIGLNRLTANFSEARLDGAVRVTDRECVEMAAYLVRNEGLFLGSSAAANCVAAVKLARLLGPGKRIVTILCDGGQRHLSKFHNPKYLADLDLAPESTGRGLDFVGPPDAAQPPGRYRSSQALFAEGSTGFMKESTGGLCVLGGGEGPAAGPIRVAILPDPLDGAAAVPVGPVGPGVRGLGHS